MSSSDSKPLAGTSHRGALVAYLGLGMYFGVVATQSQIISWYRIQEMFRFHSFHMYGVIASALAVAALSVWLIERRAATDATGEPIHLPPKDLGRGIRYAVGGTLFGIGWGLAGACPGPIFALIGNGVAGGVVLLASALLGTWCYAVVRPRLPH